MSKKTMHTYSCDRCGNEQSMDGSYNDTQKMWNWGSIWYAEWNGPKWIGSQHFPKSSDLTKDLCPSCIDLLHDWFHMKGKK
jgi:hypothetical protein